MKYHILDGNNLIHRFVHTSAYPLRTFMYTVLGAQYPIIVWDGKNALAERRKIYPEYKANRNSQNKDPITYESMDIARRIASNLECIQVRVDGFEADDVVAHMVNKLGASNIEFIHTTDIDLSGFGIPTLYQKPVPDHLKLHKTLVGKSSDNVKGLRLFGPKSWDKLSEEHKVYLIDILSENTCPLVLREPQEPLDEKLLARVIDDLDNLKKLWAISNFLDVPASAIDAGTVKGTENMQEIEMIRSEFMLWPI